MDNILSDNINIWHVKPNLKYDQPLSVDDPRYVDTEKGRGDFSYNHFLRNLRVADGAITIAPEKEYIIFCGHRGCGKSTELRRLYKMLNKDGLFFVVFLDVLEELDPNNLQYVDVLMALAKKLFEELKESSVEINKVFLTNLNLWFSERIETNEKTKELALDIKTGAEAEAGIPFLSKIFASITNSFKIGSTYKEELRSIIKNTFSQFAYPFNQLLEVAKNAVMQKGRKGGLLFMIDGTDRLAGEDARNFFIDDVNQLQLIQSNFVYSAPIHLLYEGNQVQQHFRHFTLPMIKVTDKTTREKFTDGYEVLKQMIYKRVDKKLFDSEDTVNTIIEYSGGSPRELIKILWYAFLNKNTGLFDKASVEKAIKQLATDYRRFLEKGDYQILCNIDTTGELSNTERDKFLLYNSAIFEYNQFWQMSNPVIRELDEYKKCITAATRQ
jgi:energy-coupling factor transporter ATP-binding protein EcfA2